MHPCARSWSSAVLVTLATVSAQPTSRVATASAKAHVVATHYFYWYRWPDSHFGEPGAPGPEGHLHHFPNPKAVAWNSVAWHRQELAAMTAAGIDCVLPVYWGAPEPLPGLAFAREGLAALVEARKTALARGETAPAIGLFYDTSTLANDVRGVLPRGGRPDLTTPNGRALFTGTIVEYFAQVPREHWARVEGRALVVLYAAGFAERWDATLGGSLRAAFRARFQGEDVFLVADESWREIGQDRTTRWGAALHGPSLFPGVAQIGPGFDDSAVPGRTTPFRDREDGAFYERSWRRALLHGSKLVLLETWNEMHEGTEICETKETGTQYLELTRLWTARLRSGAEPPAVRPLRSAVARQRRDDTWGQDAAKAACVSLGFAAKELHGVGLRPILQPDGPYAIEDGALAATCRGPESYVYLQVADAWRFETGGDFVLELELTSDGPVAVHYDHLAPGTRHDGAYTPGRLLERAKGSLAFALDEAWLGNRENGRADLRIAFQGRLVLRSARLCPR